MAGKSASTIFIIAQSLPGQSISDLHYVRSTVFTVYGMQLSFNQRTYFVLPKSVCLYPSQLIMNIGPLLHWTFGTLKDSYFQVKCPSFFYFFGAKSPLQTKLFNTRSYYELKSECTNNHKEIQSSLEVAMIHLFAYQDHQMK